ncbi:5-oxoprolinase subunit PxpB [Nocardioides okcheonensis]|uniref:5-oxoprolinase subunit PxpB n=1 Tax=Nocardioides okcheonensis TaxID=2894081 RepID=UPI001E3BE478|nr:5-oxoprolinase subunit PxpB [Nocardioides okcheonensis]UFN44345.1 5-oxoprolinase subunit PxpB [Nocardioides okcheonensis]
MSAAPTLLPYGDRAVLVELGSTQEAVDYAVALRGRDAPVVGEVVPAARTVLVVADEGAALADLRALLADVAPASGGDAAAEQPVVEVPVTYDGEDLADVARLTGLSEREVVAAHTGQEWRVAFGGFAPGFGYLIGQDERLHVPRRGESRTRVPAGAVGLAGEYSGIYPRSSPGGWQLIGRTDVPLWDLDRDPAALLAPGVRVRFVEASQ